MTFPLKENLIYFAGLARRQHRIYDDACDFGVKIDKATKLEARRQLTEMIKFFGAKITRWGETHHSHGSNTTLFIPIERDGRCFVGQLLDVSYNYDATRRIEFLSIEIRYASMPLSNAVAVYNCKIAA